MSRRKDETEVELGLMHTALSVAQRALSDAIARRESARDSFEQMQVEQESLRQKQADDVKTQMLEGKSTICLDTKRSEKLRDLAEKCSAMPEVLSALEKRVEEAQALVKSTRLKLLVAQLRNLSDNRNTSATAVKSAFETLAPHLVTLMAIDVVRKGLPTEDIALQAADVAGDFSGDFVAKKIIAGLTQFTRPPSLAEKRLNELVATRVLELQTMLDGGAN